MCQIRLRKNNTHYKMNQKKVFTKWSHSGEHSGEKPWVDKLDSKKTTSPEELLRR